MRCYLSTSRFAALSGGVHDPHGISQLIYANGYSPPSGTHSDRRSPRVWCASCGKTRQVEIGFAQRRISDTPAFERYPLELSRSMTLPDVAHHLGVSWDVIKDIQKRHLERRFKHIRLKDLTQIAIDEISAPGGGKGHRDLTVVLDLTSGTVVFIGQGKGADALKPFWRSAAGRTGPDHRRNSCDAKLARKPYACYVVPRQRRWHGIWHRPSSHFIHHRRGTP